MKNKWLFLISLLALFGYMRCTETPERMTGGASGTEVGAIVSGGISTAHPHPLEGALARLRPSGFLSDITALTDVDFQTIADTLTDELGRFGFSGVLPGDYTIEVMTPDSLAVLYTFSLLGSETNKELPVDTLHPMAVILGNLVPEYLNTPNVALSKIQVYGLEREVELDSMGRFMVYVPEGAHRLQIYEKGVSQETIEFQVDVVGGEYRDIGEFYRYERPPRPCSDYQCDSLVVRQYLDSINFETVPVDAVSKKVDGRMRILNLRGFGLVDIPTDFVRLSAMEELDLGKNNLNEPMRHLGGMRFLKVLRLDSNQFEALSYNIEMAKDLEILTLQDNQLTRLPITIGWLDQIQHLDISGNRLCYVPWEIKAWADRFDPGWETRQVCP